MKEIILPQVEFAERGLNDIFISQMAIAMKVSEEEARIILKQNYK